MAENTNLKPITDVPAVEELPEGATVLLNDNGAAKQILAEKIVAEPMIVKISNDIEPGTITCDKTFEEIKAASDAGKTIIFLVFGGGQELARSNVYNITFSGGEAIILVMFIDLGLVQIRSDGTIRIG